MSSGAKTELRKQTIPEAAVSEGIINKDWIDRLADHIDNADLDQAVVYIADVRAQNLTQALDRNLDPLQKLRVRCLLCEVYDYAGRRQEAQACIAQEGEYAYDDMKAAAQSESATVWKDPKALEYLKQQCWACLHLGMVAHYRQHEYDRAFRFFDLARDILFRINNNEIPIPSRGSLARAYYCLGLAERERHNLYDARRYFSESVDYAWARIVEKQYSGKGIAFLKYSIGRALGLGMAWIAYARASMSEANAHVVAARVLLHETQGVKHLRHYVDIVHACTERSRAHSVEEANKAINDMKIAYEALGGDPILQGAAVEGHFVYAQRAAAELGTAYLYAARLSPTETEDEKSAKESHLNESLKYVMLVEESLQRIDPERKDTRTRCNAFITRSRILRERGDYRGALTAAERAVGIGEDNPFSRIDCWITLGESYYHLGEYDKALYDKALDQFKKARNDARAQTNPKVLPYATFMLHAAISG